MFVPQLLVLYPSSPHIEWPGRIARNDWTEAFEWVRQNTPRDAYFVLGPRYQEAPGEDFHDFRSLAERGALADYSKDRGAVANWPALAPAWREQVHDRDNWEQIHRRRSYAPERRNTASPGPSWKPHALMPASIAPIATPQSASAASPRARPLPGGLCSAALQGGIVL